MSLVLQLVLVSAALAPRGSGAAPPGADGPAPSKAVFDAIRSGDREGLARLVGGRPEVLNTRNEDGHTPLHAAVLAKKVDIAASLLGLGAPVNARDTGGYTPVSLVALTSGDLDLVRLLAENGADLEARDVWGASVLDLAETYRRHEMARYLLRLALESRIRRPEPRRDGTTMLHLAARCGSLDAIDTLAAEGLAVDSATSSGWRPLHFAAEQGHAQAVLLLLEKKAPIDARTVDGNTAYNLAVDLGHGEVAALLAGRGADTREPAFPVLTGAYFGQRPPGRVAVPLAIVASRYRHHGSVTFSRDGREAYWAVLDFGRGRARAILESRVENGRWTLPRLASFSKVGSYDDVPFVSHDGRRLFFISARSLTEGGRPDKERIWVTERGSRGWLEPRPLPALINDLREIHHQVSTDAEGNLYFAASPEGGLGSLDIYCARLEDGVFQKPRNLGPGINGPSAECTPFIAPDGTYLLFTRYHASGWSLFVSFRRENGDWTEPVDLANEIEYPGKGSLDCPIVTRDGKHLFFAGAVDNSVRPFWVDASFLERLRRGHGSRSEPPRTGARGPR